jgi:thiamine-phosphate pyrophosphorylase
MKLSVITTSHNIEQEHDIINTIFEMGLPTLHVKKRRLSTSKMIKYLEGIKAEYHNRLILHTHRDLIWKYKLKGIHVSRNRKSKILKWWRMKSTLYIRGGGYLVGTSCKSLTSIDKHYSEFDYLMISPIFTNPYGHRPSFNPGTLKRVVPSYPGKIIARGGANVDNNSIEIAQEIGFAGISFHMSIWGKPNPVEEFEKIMNRFNQLGIEVE